MSKNFPHNYQSMSFHIKSVEKENCKEFQYQQKPFINFGNDWDFLFDSMLYVELTLESLGCDCLGAGNNSLELSEAMTLTTLYKTHPPPLRANFLVLLIILQ